MFPAGLTLCLAYALDLSLGDPRWLPHPVRGLGWVIERGESLLRSLVRSEGKAGWLLLIGVVLGTFGLVQTLRWGAYQLSPWFGFGVEAAFLYTCLSTKDLAVESRPVYQALKAGDLARARAKVAMIVGRDTEDLSEPEVVRAAVETIGESAMDGVIAPLFYAAIGGVGLACVYKAVNTLDSMVGFRSARYLKFGQPTARVDSWMNAVPARITAWLIAAAAALIGLSARESLRILYRDAWSRGENSWLPEAAMAGALGVRLGGRNFYQGKEVEAPLLGDPRRALEPERISQAIRLMWVCSFLGFLAAMGVQWGIR